MYAYPAVGEVITLYYDDEGNPTETRFMVERITEVGDELIVAGTCFSRHHNSMVKSVVNIPLRLVAK